MAVKPHAVTRVLKEVAPVIRTDYHVIVSAAAGIPIKTLEKVSFNYCSASHALRGKLFCRQELEFWYLFHLIIHFEIP